VDHHLGGRLMSARYVSAVVNSGLMRMSRINAFVS